MSKYIDLFKLSPRPEEVITMDVAISSQQKETVSNYIITSNLEGSFDKVFHSLTLDKGKGFWVQGAYGSGKSHFMSYITVLLKYDQYWDLVPERFQKEYKEKIKQKKFLTVNFTLSEVNDLKVKMFDEIEAALKRDGHIAYIKNDRQIVAQFLENEYEFINKDKFYEVLEEECQITKEEWEKIIEENNIGRLAGIIIQYKQKTGAFAQKEYREIIYPSIKDGIQQIMEEVEKHYDGLVIFIDELSGFLQKKKAEGEEAETLEILQALGQRIKNAPIWIIAAVQKNPAEIIDETLYVSEDEEKVFDRFEPIILSQADIEEIIDKRLIIKDENNKKSIAFIYQDLAKRIPKLTEYITQERFIRLYPFHHSFVSALIYLSSYGSRQRVAIRECWNIANENLNNDGEKLITIDMLYDIFRDTIIYDYFKEYYDLYENLYADIINTPDFYANFNPELAHRLIKALIINSIYSKRPLNSRELTHYLLVDMGFDMDLSLVYHDIYYNLLEVYEKSRGRGFNMQEAGEDIADFLWEIDPGSTDVKVEPEIIEEVKMLNENDVAAMIQEIINNNQHLFANYTAYWNKVSEMNISFEWRNTVRNGLTVLQNLLKMTEVPSFDPMKFDFILITGFPLFGKEDEKIKHCRKLVEENEASIFWIPRNIDKELEQDLKRLIAVKRLYKKYMNPTDEETLNKKLQLENIYNNMLDKVSKEIEKCYYSGVMVTFNKVEENLSQFNNLRSLVNYLLNHPLDELYPKHPRYSKKVERRQTNKLIRDFIVPRVSKELTDEIENVAMPFDIVEQRRGQYELRLKNEIFKEILRIIGDGEWHELDEIYRYIRLSPWGLQENGLELIVAALISSGECKGKAKDGEIFNSENFTRNILTGKKLNSLIDSISKGSLVNNTIWSEILEIMRILDIDYIDKKDSLNQDKVWSDIIKKILGLKNNINGAYRQFMELGAALNMHQEFVENLKELKDFNGFIEEVKKLKEQDSYQGLTNFRQLLLDRFMKIEFFKDKYLLIKDMLELALERIDIKIKDDYHYFTRIGGKYEEVDKVLSDFSNLPGILSKTNEIRGFAARLDSIKETYRKEYIRNHNKFYKDYRDYLKEVAGLKEFKILQLMEKIEKIKPVRSLKDVMKNIENNYQNCRINLNEDDLQDEPYCSCRLPIDEKFIPLDIDKIKEGLWTGIKEYMGELKKDSYSRQIENYLKGKQESKLYKLLSVEIYDMEGFMELVDEELVAELNRAFKATYPLEININEVLNLFDESIHVSEISKFSDKISSYLKKQVANLIEKDKNLSLEQIVIIFSHENNKGSTDNLIIELNQQEKEIYRIIKNHGYINEDDLIREMESNGYEGILVKGLVMGLNRKHVERYGENLIKIEEKDRTYYSIVRRDGIGNG